MITAKIGIDYNEMYAVEISTEGLTIVTHSDEISVVKAPDCYEITFDFNTTILVENVEIENNCVTIEEE